MKLGISLVSTTVKDWIVVRLAVVYSVFLLYNNNGDPFSKPVISPDSVCKVLKGGAVFYRHDLRRERTVKVLSRGEDVDGDRYESWLPRDFTYEEVYGLSTGSAAGGS